MKVWQESNDVAEGEMLRAENGSEDKKVDSDEERDSDEDSEEETRKRKRSKRGKKDKNRDAGGSHALAFQGMD